MARSRKLTLTLASLEECTRSMGDLLKAQLELEKLTAERDMQIAEASARFEPGIEMWKKYAAEQNDALQHYYLTHRDELEKGGRKSVQLANGIMGCRLGSGRLAPISKMWAWKTIKAKLQSLWPGKYVLQPEVEIDKDLVKAEFTPDMLAKCGMQIKKDETFYAEPARLPAPGEVAA